MRPIRKVPPGKHGLWWPLRLRIFASTIITDPEPVIKIYQNIKILYYTCENIWYSEEIQGLESLNRRYAIEKRPVGFPAHHLMLSTGEGCRRLWLAWLPYPGATIETHSLPSHLIPVKMRFAFLQNSVYSHNSETPNSHTYPNGHTNPISHTLFALTKMWLFGYGKNVGKKYICVFKKKEIMCIVLS